MKAKEIAEILMQSKNLEASIIIIQEYAKDQIKKDRERVKLNAKVSMVQFKTFDAYEIDKQSIDDTPIILD